MAGSLIGGQVLQLPSSDECRVQYTLRNCTLRIESLVKLSCELTICRILGTQEASIPTAKLQASERLGKVFR